MSSKNNILPRNGGSNGVPMDAQSTDKLPPIKRPSATPERSVEIFFESWPDTMLPGAFASMTVRKNELRVNSGKSFACNPPFHIGAWIEIMLTFFAKAQCRDVISLKPERIFR